MWFWMLVGFDLCLCLFDDRRAVALRARGKTAEADRAARSAAEYAFLAGLLATILLL